MRIQRHVTVHYEAVISRDDAIEILQDHYPEAERLDAMSDADLTSTLIAEANENDDLSWTLDDLSYETDSGNGPWEM